MRAATWWIQDVVKHREGETRIHLSTDPEGVVREVPAPDRAADGDEAVWVDGEGVRVIRPGRERHPLEVSGEVGSEGVMGEAVLRELGNGGADGQGHLTGVENTTMDKDEADLHRANGGRGGRGGAAAGRGFPGRNNLVPIAPSPLNMGRYHYMPMPPQATRGGFRFGPGMGMDAGVSSGATQVAPPMALQSAFQNLAQLDGLLGGLGVAALGGLLARGGLGQGLGFAGGIGGPQQNLSANPSDLSQTQDHSPSVDMTQLEPIKTVKKGKGSKNSALDPNWALDKDCPQCGRRVKKQKVTCHCGFVFFKKKDQRPCPDCGTSNHHNRTFCSNCQVKLRPEKRNRRGYVPHKLSYGMWQTDPFRAVVRVTGHLYSVCLYPRSRSYRCTVIYDPEGGVVICNRKECTSLNADLSKGAEEGQREGREEADSDEEDGEGGQGWGSEGGEKGEGSGGGHMEARGVQSAGLDHGDNDGRGHLEHMEGPHDGAGRPRGGEHGGPGEDFAADHGLLPGDLLGGTDSPDWMDWSLSPGVRLTHGGAAANSLLAGGNASHAHLHRQRRMAGNGAMAGGILDLNLSDAPLSITDMDAITAGPGPSRLGDPGLGATSVSSNGAGPGDAPERDPGMGEDEEGTAEDGLPLDGTGAGAAGALATGAGSDKPDGADNGGEEAGEGKQDDSACCPHVKQIKIAVSAEAAGQVEIPQATEVVLDMDVLRQMVEEGIFTPEIAGIMQRAVASTGGRVWFPRYNFVVIPVHGRPSLTGFGHVELFNGQMYCHVKKGRPCIEWRKRDFCVDHTLVAYWAFRTHRPEDVAGVPPLGRGSFDAEEAPPRRKPKVEKAPVRRYRMVRPDDWHLHLGDGPDLANILSYSAKVFLRALIMPRISPPVTTTEAALAYKQRIQAALPAGSHFQPLMTLQLTSHTTADEIKTAKQSGAVHAVVLYPEDLHGGPHTIVVDLFGAAFAVLQAMAEVGFPLLVHCEVLDPGVDVYEQEQVAIERVVAPLLEKVVDLRLVLCHVSTSYALDFIESCAEGRVAGTVTPHHLLYTRNALFQGGLNPYLHCKPVLQTAANREALLKAISGGSKRLFLGSDSIAHERKHKEGPFAPPGIFSAPGLLALYARALEQGGCLERLERLACWNGPDFFGLPRNTEKMAIAKKTWRLAEACPLHNGSVKPLAAGEEIEWSVMVREESAFAHLT